MVRYLRSGAWFLGAAALALLVFAPQTASATPITVVNGGFETGDFTGWTVTPAGGGCSDFGVNGTDPHSGATAAAFGSVCTGAYDSISQTVVTTPGGSATVTFWLTNAGGPSNDFQALWNGTVVFDTGFDVGPFPYTLESFTVPTPGASAVLTFQAYQVPSWFYLDDVGAQTTAPEPASLVLLGSGLALVIRRKLRA